MPVDLTALFNDGAVITAPDGYSYGPTILEVVPNAATADGGQQGAVIGYGFGSSASAIQVTVGGQSAPIQNLYDYAPISPYPFPVEALTFTIPPGIAGASTISITSPSGTATGMLTYTPKAVFYPVNANCSKASTTDTETYILLRYSQDPGSVSEQRNMANANHSSWNHQRLSTDRNCRVTRRLNTRRCG